MSLQDSHFTRREEEVVALLLRRLTNREIAEKLVVSERTIETHVAHILAKLEIHDRLQIAERLRGGKDQ